MRGVVTEYIDPVKQPEQLSFWPEDEPEIKLRAPGPEYPWRFHERMQYYKARCVHPAIAAILAEEDVQNHQTMIERRKRELRPPLFAVA